MSIEYVTQPGIPMGALRGFASQGVTSTDETPDSLVLTDGTNSVLVCAESDADAPCYISKGSSGDPARILGGVADSFCVQVISEHDDEWHSIVEEINAGTKQTVKPACPECGATRVASIMYGLPDYSDELKQALDSGRLALGGCEVAPENPVWCCNDCGHWWGRAPRREVD